MTLTRSWRAALLPVVLTATVLSGCGGGDDEGAPSATPSVLSTDLEPSPLASPSTASASPSATPTATPTVRRSRVPGPVAPRPPDLVPPGSGVTVVLEPDGLGFRSGTAATRHVPFGSDVSTITASLGTSLGKGTTRSLAECGQGPRTQVEYNGFTVLLDGNDFVGWNERGSPTRDLSTADGIALQVTLAEVRAAYPKTKVSTDSLGPEFFNEGGISGFLDGTRAQSRVTQLYGGETCFFR